MCQANLITLSSGTKFDASSVLVCPDCNETVQVGFGGLKNLAMHRTSKGCQSKQEKKKRAPERQSKVKQDHDLRTFFKARVPLNPPTVVAPPPIHTDETSFSGLSEIPELELDTPGTRKKAKKAHKETPAETRVEAGVSPLLEVGGKTPCPKGVELLDKIEVAIARIPDNIPLATPEHRLSIFSADPRSWVASLEKVPEADFEGDWMTLNSMLKTAFGWGESEMRMNVKEMLNRGEHGLDGFVQFFKYFILQRGLEGAMIEPKFEGLLCEIDNQCVHDM